MRRQTERALAEADVVLFVIDAREGVTPLDASSPTLLRRADKPVVLVANKSEGGGGDAGVARGLRPGPGRTRGDLRRARRGAGRSLRTPSAPPCRSERRRRRSTTRSGSGQAGADRRRRPAQRWQVDPGQPPDRRGPVADRPGGRHHPRRHLGRLDVARAPLPPGRHRRHAAQGARCERASRSSRSPTLCAPSPSPRWCCW